MTEPIVFISHFSVREGRSDAYRRLQVEVSEELRAEKPLTLAYLTYLDDSGARMTAVHIFGDHVAMDRHFDGADNRSRRADMLIPRGWEIYGRPSPAVTDAMRSSAASADVPLVVDTAFVAGFLRR